MPRNPIVGGDRNMWGTVLNEKLDGIDRTDPGAAGTVGQLLTIGPDGPAWVTDSVFNVKHPRFGATGDGTTDDSPAIAAAVAAARAAGGGEILFPPGNYRITEPITPGPVGTEVLGLSFRAAIPYATRILIGHPTSDAFYFGPTHHLMKVEGFDISVTFGQARTDGSAIHIDGASEIQLRNLRLGSTFNLITIHNGAGGVFADTIKYYREPDGTGYINRGIYLQHAVQVHVHRMIGTLGAAPYVMPDGNAMFHVDSTCDTAIFTECVDASGGHGAQAHIFRTTHTVTGGTNFAPRIVRFINCYAEAGATRVGYLIQAGQDIEIATCYAATSLTGYRFTGGKEIRVHHSIAYNIREHGFEMTPSGADHIELDHCSASDCSQATHNIAAGFSLDPTGKTYFSVTNCRAGDWMLGLANKQAYGLIVWAGSATSYRLQDNFARGNATAQIQDNGTATTTKAVSGNL